MNPGRRIIHIAFALTVTWVAGGASCYRGKSVNDFSPPPEIFSGAPTRQEITNAINRTDGVTKLHSNSATIKVLSRPLLPSLRANLAIERPRRIRMRASLPVVMGSGMDLGSNEELFWMKIPEGMGTSLYFARHADYQQQLQRAILPVDPTWLIDALGMTHVDESQIESGPTERADGQYEIKIAQTMADGVYHRVLTVDARQGVVTELLLYGPDNRLLANATCDDFRFLKEANCSLPHNVQLRLTPNGWEPMALKIEVGSYSVNQLLSDDPRLFAMPEDGHERPIDLTRIQPPGTPLPSGASAGELPGLPPGLPPLPATLAPQPTRWPNGPPSASPNGPPTHIPMEAFSPNQSSAAANFSPTMPAGGYVPHIGQGVNYRGVYR